VAVQGCSRQRQQKGGRSSMQLQELPDRCILEVCRRGGLCATDVVRLGAVSRRFARRGATQGAGTKEKSAVLSSGAPASLAECAAETILRCARAAGWRVQPRPGESWTYALHVWERLCPPPRIGAGAAHTLVVGCLRPHPPRAAAASAARTLVAFGWDCRRQLGQGDGEAPIFTEERQRDRRCVTPVEVTAASTMGGVVSVAVGSVHSTCLGGRGELWLWGRAAEGQLGCGRGERNAVAAQPLRVRLPPRCPGAVVAVASVAAAEVHSACVTALGELYTWGQGAVGQLGHGSTESQLVRQPGVESLCRGGCVCSG
jgi:hypothetical protein